MSEKAEAVVVEDAMVDFELDFMMTDPPERPGVRYEEVNPSILAEIDFFKDIPAELLRAALKACRVVVIDAKQVLLTAGQLNLRMYFLLEGQLQIFRDDSGDKAVGVVDIGQVVGVLSAVDQKPGTESIYASEESRLLAIDVNSMQKLCQNHHPAALRFVELLMACIRGENYIPLDEFNPRHNRGRVGYVDELTGLHNNRWLQRILPRHINRCSANQQPLALAILAVDKFDEFKQDFGDKIADHALRTVGQLIMDNARPTDMHAHYDENRFAVILPDTDLKGAAVLAQRLAEETANTQIIIPNECALPPVTVSVGIVELDKFSSAEGFMQKAHEALKASRAKGGNWVSVGSDGQGGQN